MRIFSLAIVALACGLAAQPASAMPITLKITYEGMPATAENEISSVTFTETGGSFTHPISNLSPELLQLVALGSLLSDVTFTAFDGAISLGSFTFSDVQFTSLAPAGGGSSEQVSFLFDPPSEGFYTLDYPGISPFGEDDISSLTLDQAGASFGHPSSINSPQLLEFLVLGTVLPNFTLIPVDASSPFGNLRFENVFFTSIVVTISPKGDIFEDVSIDFSGLAIEPTAAQVPEPSTWLMTMGSAVVLAIRRRAYLRKGQRQR
jgi:type VI protein secretion system component Hcp